MVYFYFYWLDYGLILSTTDPPPPNPPGNLRLQPVRHGRGKLLFGPHAGPVRGGHFDIAPCCKSVRDPSHSRHNSGLLFSGLVCRNILLRNGQEGSPRE
jgi:hypothetical protein